ncbi:hypothetical protein BKA65DRAFT_507370 [Rhexocercosporidium sp. MPI-PUGE-AT-0058]|nr:hypothetical protein BKA65DRAFT_507370 [Rhexocercosporidium sp. MPI-PUGE-AT-0058]
MAKQRTLRNFWRHRSGANDKSRLLHPPPYEFPGEGHLKPRSKLAFTLKFFRFSSTEPKLEPRILATDIPQWCWSILQCREWIAAVLMHYMNYGRPVAVSMAGRFEGYGPNIYLRDRQEWIKILGEHNGRGVYEMILSVRRSKGAVPKKNHDTSLG